MEVAFTFRNQGDKAVTILGLESGCSCLSSSLDARTYAPGASGTGKAEFKVSSFVGRHEKSVTVTTDDPNQPRWEIPFVLDVPAVVSIEPKTLQWWLGGEADEPVELRVREVELPEQVASCEVHRTRLAGWHVRLGPQAETDTSGRMAASISGAAMRAPSPRRRGYSARSMRA